MIKASIHDRPAVVIDYIRWQALQVKQKIFVFLFDFKGENKYVIIFHDIFHKGFHGSFSVNFTWRLSASLRTPLLQD